MCATYHSIAGCSTNNLGKPPGDRAALVDLYNAAGGAGWARNLGWSTAAGVCTWSGVTCNADGSRVTKLCVAARVGAARRTARSDDGARRELQDTYLSGTIPSSIGSLTALTSL